MVIISEILSEDGGCSEEDVMMPQAKEPKPEPESVPVTSTTRLVNIYQKPAPATPTSSTFAVPSTKPLAKCIMHDNHNTPSTSAASHVTRIVKQGSDEQEHHAHSHSSGSDSDGEERPSKPRKLGSVLTLSSVDQTTCAVTSCKNRSRDMSMWRNQKCPTHKGRLQGECDCRFNQAFYLSIMKKLNSLQTAMFYELCWDDTRIQAVDAHWKPSKHHKVCSQHFCKSMENYVYAFPILGLNKSRQRIRLIAKKYGLELLLPEDFDTMDLSKNRIVPQVKVLSARSVNCGAILNPFPLKPSRLVGDNEFSNLIYSSDDELYGVNGTAPPPSLEGTWSSKMDPRSKRAFLRGNESRIAKEQSVELQAETRHKWKPEKINKEALVAYAKQMGCLVITADHSGMVKENVKKMRNRCIVVGCAHRLSTNDLFISLPINFEVALHCIAVCMTSVDGQNMHMTKIIESAKRHNWDDLMTKDPTDDSTVRILPQATLEECSLYFCHRHLNIKAIAAEVEPMLKIKPMLTEFLPEQKELYSHTGRVAYLLNNRHKMWNDCKMGCEISKIVPGLRAVPTPSDIAKSMESASSYHCAIPDCWSNKPWMAGRVQMLAIPTVEEEYMRWYLSVLAHLGDVHIPKTGFLCAHHFPDSDFIATIPRTFHTVKKKSGVVKCAVRSCSHNEMVFKDNGYPVRLVPLPAEYFSRVRWWSQLTAGDPLFGRFLSSQAIFICERHFVNIMDMKSIPSLNLRPPRNSFTNGTSSVAYHRSWIKRPCPMVPRWINNQGNQNDPRVLTSEVRAADRALPPPLEHIRTMSGPVTTDLSRLMDKSKTLLDLIKALDAKMDVPLPRRTDFNEKGDDMKMYGKLKKAAASHGKTPEPASSEDNEMPPVLEPEIKMETDP